jgi:hypothetical protein
MWGDDKGHRPTPTAYARGRLERRMARGDYSITPHVYLTGWGLVGAGGADLDWDVAAGLGYRFNERFSAVAGYRALGVNYSENGFVFDVVQQGPIMGVVIHF